MTPGVYTVPPTELRNEATVHKPYGERVPTFTALHPESKGRTRERFDPETGHQYLNARTYDPELGMFIQPDWWEVTKPGVGTNRYGYSFGDPVNKMDPGGNAWYNDWGDFKGLFSGSETKDATGRTTIQSAPILRAVVPGQVAWDNARTSWANGEKLNSLVYGTAMLGEAALAGATVGIGGTAVQVTKPAVNVGIATVSAEAKLSQTASGYATDAWSDTVLSAGTKVIGGLPGQSEYYTTQEALTAAKGSAKGLWEALQVRAHPTFGYRTSVGVYEVTQDIAAATGKALANGDLEAGGAQQYVIREFSEALKLIDRPNLGK